jgi:hypothetical protein
LAGATGSVGVVIGVSPGCTDVVGIDFLSALAVEKTSVIDAETTSPKPK